MEATSEQVQAWIELSARDASAAVAALLRADAILAEFGERSLRSTTQALLARAHEMDNAAGVAQSAIDLAEVLSAPQEAANYAITHEVRGRLALRRGDTAAAERWARSALDYALKTDFVELQAGARLGLAHVLAALGRKEEASSEGQVSLRLFDAKGDRPGEQVARTLLGGLAG
jgi:ATP/maltotriose-dependent transcriptional regulator MalT